MNLLPVPDWVQNDPDVTEVREFHLPEGSGISGPPAGAFLIRETEAENALRPHPMWHMLFEVTDEDLAQLRKTRVLCLAVSVVPIFQLHPWHVTKDGKRSIEETP